MSTVAATTNHENGDGALLAQLTADEVSRLSEGTNFVKQNSVLVYLQDGRIVSAYRNRCQHQNGRFVHCKDDEDIEDTLKSPRCIVKCSRHGWKLNTRTGLYTNPPNSVEQPALKVVETKNGSVSIYDESPRSAPWLPQLPRAPHLVPGEFTVCYWTHACVEISIGGQHNHTQRKQRRLLCDPWCTGPAFGRGWWLTHRPPDDWIERAASCDAIYISHKHSDHLSVPSLKLIAERNPDVAIYVGNLVEPVLPQKLQESIGLRNVNVVELETWQSLGEEDEDGRFMILGDGAMPELDTMLLVEYRGWRLVNFVDCNLPSSLNLPFPVDVALSEFACGSSGFPSCFADTFGEEPCIRMADAKRKKFLHKIVEQLKMVQASWFVPIAGYFTPHPQYDPDIVRLNKVNTAKEAADFVERRLGSTTKSWLPFPGGSFDVGLGQGEGSMLFEEYKSSFFLDHSGDSSVQDDDKSYIEEIRTSSRSAHYLDDMDAVRRYFQWAGFCNYDYVLHIVESSDNFDLIVRQYLVDFRGSEATVEQIDSNELLDLSATDSMCERPYERLRVRADVLRFVYVEGESWDIIYIGFQGRYKVNPDIYHHKFHQHFRHFLPAERPSFNVRDATL